MAQVETAQARTRTRRISEAGRAFDNAGLSDEDLVLRARSGDSHAQAELLDRYRRFARAKARSYFLVGGDRDDIIQEGMIGLYKAIRDYSAEHGASFRSFAELCITRQILTAIKTATRQKHVPLNSYVSFDKPQGDDPGRTVGDTIHAHENTDPLNQLLSSDELAYLNSAFGEILSDLESDVLHLYVEGRSYQEIAEQLDRHVKSIDNAIQRIKRKLEQHLSDRADLLE